MAPNCDLEVVKSVLFSGWFLSFPPSQLHSFPCLSGVTQYFSLFLCYVKKKSYIYLAPSLCNLLPLPYRSYSCLVSPPSPPPPRLWAQLGNELSQHMVTYNPAFGPSTFSSFRLHRASCTRHRPVAACPQKRSETEPGNQLLTPNQPNIKKKMAEAKMCKLESARSRTCHPLLLGPSQPQHFQHHYHPLQIITWKTRALLVIAIL